ncbi:hypothetical protein GDO86_007323 [Hymenochirus boettgeri]|uniref:Uncharacterized protein n=1 Tax=Hymenochirus boettgeri TaxID=247094 RepID=A0A8T2IT96_9PIPI|nr:hypothetical protein GDO86_007323 [Hymenochirus boettgeri]
MNGLHLASVVIGTHLIPRCRTLTNCNMNMPYTFLVHPILQGKQSHTELKESKWTFVLFKSFLKLTANHKGILKSLCALNNFHCIYIKHYP